VSNDPYAAPSANLDNSADAAVIQTSPWNAKGRLSVLSYLGQTFVLGIFSTIFFGALIAIAATMGGAMPTTPEAMAEMDFSNPIFIVLGIVAAILYIVLLYFTAVMIIKRLHDRNHSGWWCLALFVGFIIPFVNIVAFIALFYVIFFPGNKTGNRFGGVRPTKGWEKVLGILYIVLMVGILVATFAGGAAMFMGAA